jgi:hypothetical protein
MVFDLCGVLLLGYDLLRLQRSLVHDSSQRLADLDEHFGGYSPPEEWADEVRANSRWVNAYEYSEYHAEDEISYNVRRHDDALKEVAETFDFIAVRLAALAKMEISKANADAKSASYSFGLSIIGFILISVGFFVQILGLLLS